MITLRNYQLESGTAEHVLGKIREIPTYITSTWITQIWKFLHEHDYDIEVKDIQIQEPQREHDVYIMNALQQVPQEKLKAINECRMYLHDITISDIANINGRTVDTRMQDGTTPLPRKLRWPRMVRPPEQCWKVWRWSIKKYILNQDGDFKTRLGAWRNVKRHIHHNRMWLKSMNSIYLNHGEQWHEHAGTNQQNTTFTMTPEKVNNIPDDCIPAAITYHQMQYNVDANYHEPPTSSPYGTILPIQNAINKLPFALRQALGNITLPRDECSDIICQLKKDC